MSAIGNSGSGRPHNSDGTDWLMTKMPPDEPGSTLSTPACDKSLMASRNVGRLTPSWVLRFFSEGSLSPTRTSPARIASEIR